MVITKDVCFAFTEDLCPFTNNAQMDNVVDDVGVAFGASADECKYTSVCQCNVSVYHSVSVVLVSLSLLSLFQCVSVW